MKIVIIGSGNVAEALAVALAEGGMPAEQVWARNEVRGREVARLGDSRWCGEAAGLAATMTDDFSALDIKELQKILLSRGVVLHNGN